MNKNNAKRLKHRFYGKMDFLSMEDMNVCKSANSYYNCDLFLLMQSYAEYSISGLY